MQYDPPNYHRDAYGRYLSAMRNWSAGICMIRMGIRGRGGGIFSEGVSVRFKKRSDLFKWRYAPLNGEITGVYRAEPSCRIIARLDTAAENKGIRRQNFTLEFPAFNDRDEVFGPEFPH